MATTGGQDERRARRVAEAEARWTVMSIPGREADGSDTLWMAYDRQTRDSLTFRTWAAARAEARLRNG